MKVIYIASMYHTNQVPIIRGWIKEGDSPLFICHTKGITENHADVAPLVLGFSSVFKVANWIHKRYLSVFDPYTSFPEAFEGKFGFPSFTKFKKILKDFSPDLVIIRDRSIYSILCYLACRICKKKAILYNQTPYWNTESRKNDLFHMLVYKLTPQIRMTPVLGNPKVGTVDGNSYYIPFVIDTKLSFAKREYFKNARVNILCVGKYEERKNQLMLLNIIKKLSEKYSVYLTLVGEVSTLHHKTYFDKVASFINENEMQNIVKCYKNCEPSEMDSFYSDADLFVLPSTKEFASFSQMEAMAFSIPAIVSNLNGTACYILPGETGELFLDNNEQSLMEKIEFFLMNQDKIPEMGKRGYEQIRDEYSFARYKQSIVSLATSMDDDKKNLIDNEEE